jgi:hypothetical protein
MPSRPALACPASDPTDLAALLAELDDLNRRAQALRLRLSKLESPSAKRPGWPILRMGNQPASPARA